MDVRVWKNVLHLSTTPKTQRRLRVRVREREGEVEEKKKGEGNPNSTHTAHTCDLTYEDHKSVCIDATRSNYHAQYGRIPEAINQQAHY
eukprot:m.160347 g.160347  ORF g.160347 m.160347 type:complete len:89 (+) comp13383_c4_seq1:499-765(+)